MPHVILEYAEQLDKEVEIGDLLQAIHASIDASGLYPGKQIRTRAYPFRVFTNGGGNAPYIHIQARIKSGRDAWNRKELSDVILAGLQQLQIPAQSVTVEIIDMDRDSYGKLA